MVRRVAVDEPQIHHRQPVDAERSQVGLDIPAEVVGVDERYPTAGIVAAGADLAHQRQVLRIRVEGLADELIGDIGPVELGGVDVVNTEFDGASQHRQRLVAVPRWPEGPGARKLDAAKADAGDGKPAEWEMLHGIRLASGLWRRFVRW